MMIDRIIASLLGVLVASGLWATFYQSVDTRVRQLLEAAPPRGTIRCNDDGSIHVEGIHFQGFRNLSVEEIGTTFQLFCRGIQI